LSLLDVVSCDALSLDTLGLCILLLIVRSKEVNIVISGSGRCSG